MVGDDAQIGCKNPACRALARDIIAQCGLTSEVVGQGIDGMQDGKELALVITQLYHELFILPDTLSDGVREPALLIGKRCRNVIGHHQAIVHLQVGFLLVVFSIFSHQRRHGHDQWGEQPPDTGMFLVIDFEDRTGGIGARRTETDGSPPGKGKGKQPILWMHESIEGGSFVLCAPVEP